MKKTTDAGKVKLKLKLETTRLLQKSDLTLAAAGSQTEISFGHKPGQCVPDGG
jgi:hypothetical protein